MEVRYLVTGIQETAFAAGKMAFASGPRQCGKTTLGRILLGGRQEGRYANWDDVEIRRLSYLFDWGEVTEPGARFENMLACHLLKAVDYWTDIGEGDFSLNFLRDKEKRELDFLVVRDRKPWLAVEAKLSDTALSPAWKTFLPQLGCDTGLQVVEKSGQWTWHDVGRARVLVASADALLPYLV